MSVQILQKFSESIYNFCETLNIRTLVLINLTDNIIIKTTVWENQFETKVIFIHLKNLDCVEVLRPSQPNRVMSSAVSLLNHTVTGQA